MQAVTALYDSIEGLERDWDQGRRVPSWPDLRRFDLRSGRRGHGHVVFYRIEEQRIEVIRVLHTARSWPDLLEDE